MRYVWLCEFAYYRRCCFNRPSLAFVLVTPVLTGLCSKKNISGVVCFDRRLFFPFLLAVRSKGLGYLGCRLNGQI